MNIAQLALLAGGAFMLYSYYTRGGNNSTGAAGSTGSSGSGGTSSTGNTTSDTTGSNGTTTNSTTGTSGSSSAATIPLDEAIRKAANGDSVAAAQVRAAQIVFNVDQWNYFRALDGAIPVDATAMDLMITPSESRAALLTIDEYRARLGRIGLGSIRWRDLRPINRWET